MTDDAPQAPSPKLSLAWTLALIPILWAFGYRKMMGSDLWWHLASGDWMREHGQIVRQDPFSFSQFGEPWFHHEWLADVLTSLWVSQFGLESLVVWKWGLIVLTFLLMFRVASKLTGSPGWSAFAVMLGGATAAPFLDIRPQLYTFLGVAVLLNLFWGEGRTRWAAPLVIAFWVNLHGGFIFALIALGVLMLPEVAREPERWKKAGGLMLVCALAACLNPHGVQALVFPFRYSLNSDNPYLIMGEWRSPLEPGGLVSPLFLWLAAFYVVLSMGWYGTRLRSHDRRFLSAFLLGFLTLAMAFKSRRFIPLFSVCQVVVTAGALHALLGRVSARLPWFLGPAVTFLLGLSCLWPYPKSPERAFTHLAMTERFPWDLTEAMKLNKVEGRVFGFYNWGGFLHLQGKGAWKVFIDGRADTVYEGKHLKAYSAVLGDVEGWTQLLDKCEAEFFLWPGNDQKDLGVLHRVLDTGQWEVLYRDGAGVLLGRKSLGLGPLKVPPDSAQRQATLGREAAMQNDFETAEGHYRKALEMKPTTRYFQILEFVLEQAGKTDEAAEVQRQRRANFPEDTLFQRIVGL